MDDLASFVVVTGLSGAGKSTALKALDDTGHYCVDNLPPSLVADTVRECSQNGLGRIALGIDVRVGAFLDAAAPAIERLAGLGGQLDVLFLTASDDVLVRRFSETRRPHPLLTGVLVRSSLRSMVSPGDAGRDAMAVLDGVRIERERLAPIQRLATVTIDTSHLSVHELRREVLAAFSTDPSAAESRRRMRTRVMSFGFKYGVPLDADLVFDVRFLRNPHFERDLRPKSGIDDVVRDYVLASDGAGELLRHLDALLGFALPRYEHEGKSYLTIAIGCTGGRHRSVALARELRGKLAAQGVGAGIVHRDLQRGGMMNEVTVVGPEQREQHTRQAAAAEQLPEGEAEGGEA